jgi:phage protein Gp37/Gp68
MGESSIEWTNVTWNPIAGCTIVSPGCTNCYAMRMAARLEAMGIHKYRGLTRRSGDRFVWNWQGPLRGEGPLHSFYLVKTAVSFCEFNVRSVPRRSAACIHRPRLESDASDPVAHLSNSDEASCPNA